MSGEKFLANKSPSKMEVHDLDAETKNCQINEIITANHEVPYNSLAIAKSNGYDNCHWCIGGSTR
jgi:hypothetical protein